MIETINTDQIYETDGAIESEQTILSPLPGDPTIEYNSGSGIVLLPGFEVKAGTVLRAHIDGCNND